MSTLLLFNHATAEIVCSSKPEATSTIFWCSLNSVILHCLMNSSSFLVAISVAVKFCSFVNSLLCFSTYGAKRFWTNSDVDFNVAQLAAYLIAWNSKGSLRFAMSFTSRFTSINTIFPLLSIAVKSLLPFCAFLTCFPTINIDSSSVSHSISMFRRSISSISLSSIFKSAKVVSSIGVGWFLFSKIYITASNHIPFLLIVPW